MIKKTCGSAASPLCGEPIFLSFSHFILSIVFPVASLVPSVLQRELRAHSHFLGRKNGTGIGRPRSGAPGPAGAPKRRQDGKDHPNDGASSGTPEAPHPTKRRKKGFVFSLGARGLPSPSCRRFAAPARTLRAAPCYFIFSFSYPENGNAPGAAVK